MDLSLSDPFHLWDKSPDQVPVVPAVHPPLTVSLNPTLLICPEPAASQVAPALYLDVIWSKWLWVGGRRALWKSVHISGSFNFDEWKKHSARGGVRVVEEVVGGVLLFAAAAP